MRYALTPNALQDLADVLDYIRADKPLAVDPFADRLLKTFGTLASMPGIGTKDNDTGSLEFAFERNYRIVYEADAPAQMIWITHIDHVAKARTSSAR